MFIKSRIRLHSASLIYFIAAFLLTLQLAGFLTSLCFAEDTKKGYLIDRALEAIAMNRADLSMRSDISTNPFALSRFKRWMENPIKAPAEAQRKAMDLFGSANNPVLWFQELAKLGDPVKQKILVPFKLYKFFTMADHPSGARIIWQIRLTKCVNSLSLK